MSFHFHDFSTLFQLFLSFFLILPFVCVQGIVISTSRSESFVKSNQSCQKISQSIKHCHQMYSVEWNFIPICFKKRFILMILIIYSFYYYYLLLCIYIYIFFFDLSRNFVLFFKLTIFVVDGRELRIEWSSSWLLHKHDQPIVKFPKTMESFLQNEFECHLQVFQLCFKVVRFFLSFFLFANLPSELNVFSSSRVPSPNNFNGLKYFFVA